MDKNDRLAHHLQILYSALEVARQGLGILKDQEPIAKKTLEEIDKICNKVWEE